MRGNIIFVAEREKQKATEQYNKCTASSVGRAPDS